MSDLPDYVAFVPHLTQACGPWPGFPHRLALLPVGTTLEILTTVPSYIGAFLVEPGSIGEVLNGGALLGYIAIKVPVIVHARRARDLRPLLRRAASFHARNYTIEVLP